jgi:hypothetical protein
LAAENASAPKSRISGKVDSALSLHSGSVRGDPQHTMDSATLPDRGDDQRVDCGIDQECAGQCAAEMINHGPAGREPAAGVADGPGRKTARQARAQDGPAGQGARRPGRPPGARAGPGCRSGWRGYGPTVAGATDPDRVERSNGGSMRSRAGPAQLVVNPMYGSAFATKFPPNHLMGPCRGLRARRCPSRGRRPRPGSMVWSRPRA